jgi:hypothetical protein
MDKKRLVESKDESGDLEFDYCDIDDLKVSTPEGVKDLELCYANKVYRLSYAYYEKKFIKYFAVKSSSMRTATDFAEADAEIDELGLNPSNCVDIVRNLVDTEIRIPDTVIDEVGETMRAHYPDGKAAEHSDHYYDTVINGKVGHGVFPPELFDAWSKRVLKFPPRDICFICDTVGLGLIVIPIKAAYLNHCRELDDIFNKVLKSVINIVPKEKRARFRARPGLNRVFAYPISMVVTEYFRLITPKDEYYIYDLEDDNVKPIPADVFDKTVEEEIMYACRNFLQHWKK